MLPIVAAPGATVCKAIDEGAKACLCQVVCAAMEEEERHAAVLQGPGGGRRGPDAAIDATCERRSASHRPHAARNANSDGNLGCATPVLAKARPISSITRAARGPLHSPRRRVVLRDRIDAEFLADMGEFLRVGETPIHHHRAQRRQTSLGEEQPRQTLFAVEPHQRALDQPPGPSATPSPGPPVDRYATS